MFHTASDPSRPTVTRSRARTLAPPREPALRWLAALGLSLSALALAASGGSALSAQEAEASTVEAPDAPTEAVQADADATAQAARRLVGYATDMDRNGAELTLEFAGGRQVAFEVREGRVYVDGRRIGTFDAREASWDESWRNMLRDLDGSAAAVAREIIAWDPSGDGVQEALDDALEDFLSGAAGEEAYLATPSTAPLDGAGDSVTRLNVRIQELERALEDLERQDFDRARFRDGSRSYGRSFGRNVAERILSILGILVKYAVLMALGIGVVYFGGRPYLETVADAARRQPVRAWAVGFAGMFLVVPAFVIGILVLVVSVVGIPALIVWAPGFPIAVMLSVVLGFLAVAHGAGEAMAERRFRGGEWFHRANSYYYLMTGIGLLLALPLASNAVGILPLMGWLAGILKFVGVVALWLAATIGFGAVLMTRAGTRQPDGSRTQPASADPADDLRAEPEAFDA